MDQSRHRSFAVRLACACIRLYQLLAAGFPPRCRFAPSCSVYATDALNAHGLIAGLRLTAIRILKCHPWNAGGYDPIPLRRM